MKGVNQGLQQGKQEGRQEGRQEGIQQGMHQGYAKALALQLRLRFGAVPQWVDTRLAQASEEQLMDWMGRILTASSLSELFGAAGQGDLS
ncbi:MAG: hypothetical protein C0441_04175 [Comamonadaceae bacterium]|nr:hypothetical protein [Comamonadaceae bacterium]